MDFNNYQSQIRTLIPLLNEADFNDVFNKVFVGESNSDKFLLKMEINRITQPCVRIIDLREKVTEKTYPYTHNGLDHHLTTSAIETLKETIKLFGDYTIGANEAVLNHVQKVKLQNQNKKPNANETTFSEIIQLNSHKVRANARMFFISPIIITLPNGAEFKASTSNISTSGLKIKLSEDIPCINDQTIEVIFTGICAEYRHKSIDDGKKIAYRLVSQEEDDGTFYFYLQIRPEQEDFVEFLKSFIRGNQYKYKIDVQYYYNLALENSLKNSALRAMATLPIYLNMNSPKPALFMLQNATNAQTVNDWRYNDANQLAFLLSGERLKGLLDYTQHKSSTTIYCFTFIKNDVEYLLSATEYELQQDKTKQLFIQYGKNKLNFRTYHFSLEPYRYHENQRYEITSLKPASFSDITHVATVTELTTNEIIEEDTREVKQSLNLLNKYVHRGKATGITTPVFNLFPDELRKEERYKHTSAIKFRVDGYFCTGHIIDFSFSGLKVQLDQVPTLTKRSIVRIDFVDLQKVSKKFRLVGIQYKAIASSPGRIYHLQIASKECFQSMHKFFSLLVKNNPEHFPIIPLKEPKQPVTDRLHEVAESSLDHALFFVTTGSGKPKLTYSSVPASAKSLKNLFEIDSDQNITHNHIALSNNDLLERILYSPFRNATTDGVKLELTIYVKKIKSAEGVWTISSYLDEDFSSDESKRQFILMQKETGQLQILHYRLCSISAPDLSIIESEISMISRHAVHLGKRIQEVLLGVGAIIEVIDRTDHILANSYENEP